MTEWSVPLVETGEIAAHLDDSRLRSIGCTER
jgi:hypothetical protein